MDPKKYKRQKTKRYSVKMTPAEAAEQLVNAEYAEKYQGDQKLATATLMAVDALEAIKPLCNRCLILTKASTCIFCTMRDLCDIARKQYTEVNENEK